MGNLSGDNIKFRDLLLKAGVFELTIQFLEKNIEYGFNFKEPLRNAVWVLSNLCRDKPPENSNFTYQAFPVFCRIIDKLFHDVSVFIDASYAMKQLALIYLSNFFLKFKIILNNRD